MMDALLEKLPDLIAGAVIGAGAGWMLNEVTRVWRKTRLLVGPARLPSLVLTLRDDRVEISMNGDYSVVNMSDLPVSLRAPHPLILQLGQPRFPVQDHAQAKESIGQIRPEGVVRRGHYRAESRGNTNG
jgi:hypothetical protein